MILFDNKSSFQLAPNSKLDFGTGFADIRWAQTADLGRTPNTQLPNTFMAVAMDLPDYSSPHLA